MFASLCRRVAGPRAAKPKSSRNNSNSDNQNNICLAIGFQILCLWVFLCLAGALGVDFEAFRSHWGVFLVPWGAILQSFWCLGGLSGSLWALVRCRLPTRRPGTPGESAAERILLDFSNCWDHFGVHFGTKHQQKIESNFRWDSGSPFWWSRGAPMVKNHDFH